MASIPDEHYPNIAWWVRQGRLEIGWEYYTDPFIRLIDEGGTVWESEKEYKTIVEALADVEAAAKKLADERGW